MSNSKESADRLMGMIKNAGRPVTFAEIRDFQIKEKLYFGPNFDTIDFLRAKKALGLVRISVKRAIVEMTPPIRSEMGK